MTEEAERLAMRLWLTARDHEHCALRVPDDIIATEVRQRVRHLAREDGIRIRTARMGDSIVAIRLDAQISEENAVTMRRKLTPE